MKKKHLILLSLLSGVILTLGWPERGFPFLLFVGLVPLLIIEDHLFRHRQDHTVFSAIGYSYPAFFLWNLLTTYWIYYSTDMGAIMAIVLNALFMSIVFMMFHLSRRKMYFRGGGYLAMVVYWMSFEYLHLNWDLNWPWLNLGNGFAAWIKWVQWYEYTGAFGGTLWVLVLNILLFLLIKTFLPGNAVRHRLGLITSIISVLAIPMVFSLFRYHRYVEKDEPVSIIVVQPNLDPYSEQYALDPMEVVRRMEFLASQQMDSSVSIVVSPESAIQEKIWENDLPNYPSVLYFRDFSRHHQGVVMIVGASTFRLFQPGEKISMTARTYPDAELYYDAYNTAFIIDSAGIIGYSHKSKLTPGVEKLPSFRNFRWLEQYAIDLGGTVGSLGVDSVRRVFRIPVIGKNIGVTICYESIFGEYFATYVKNGAQLMFVITNDGWWGNTPGHRQHFLFSKLRAIETRRGIARSANTGISAFIDQRGDAWQVTPYWEPAAIKGILNSNDTLTFYVRYGDYLARIAMFTTFLLLLLTLVSWIMNRKKT